MPRVTHYPGDNPRDLINKEDGCAITKAGGFQTFWALCVRALVVVVRLNTPPVITALDTIKLGGGMTLSIFGEQMERLQIQEVYYHRLPIEVDEQSLVGFYGARPET